MDITSVILIIWKFLSGGDKCQLLFIHMAWGLLAENPCSVVLCCSASHCKWKFGSAKWFLSALRICFGMLHRWHVQPVKLTNENFVDDICFCSLFLTCDWLFESSLALFSWMCLNNDDSNMLILSHYQTSWAPVGRLQQQFAPSNLLQQFAGAILEQFAPVGSNSNLLHNSQYINISNVLPSWTSPASVKICVSCTLRYHCRFVYF